MTLRAMKLRIGVVLSAAVVSAAVLAMVATPTAAAFDPLRTMCGTTGPLTGPASACGAARSGGRLLSAGTQLASGNVSGALGTVIGGASSSALTAVAGGGLTALVVLLDDGSQAALRETAHVLVGSTTPQLAAPWFAAVYWRVAGIALVLTLPFLFAAAVQAIIRADLGLLARAAFGYLPLATLGVALAAQLAGLLLALTDGLSGLLADAAGGGPEKMLGQAAAAIGARAIATSPFVAFFVAGFTVAGALTLWVELYMRDAAVYVVVLLLPFAFVALVWPARRAWALRAAELLVALILSKLVIVAVLTLGAAAFTHSSTMSGTLTGLILVLLGVFAPWAMMRLVPFAELADGAVSRLRHEVTTQSPAGLALAAAGPPEEWMRLATARMRRDADHVSGDGGRPVAGGEVPRPGQPAGDASALYGSTAGDGGRDDGAAEEGGPGDGESVPDTGSGTSPGTDGTGAAERVSGGPRMRGAGLHPNLRAANYAWDLPLNADDGSPPRPRYVDPADDPASGGPDLPPATPELDGSADDE